MKNGVLGLAISLMNIPWAVDAEKWVFFKGTKQLNNEPGARTESPDRSLMYPIMVIINYRGGRVRNALSKVINSSLWGRGPSSDI